MLTKSEWLRTGKWLALGLVAMAFGLVGRGTGCPDDDGAGNSVSGERTGRHRDTERELAGVYNRRQSGCGGGPNDGGDCPEWIREREPGSQRGRNAGRAVLHGYLLPERREDEHGILGGSRHGAGRPGAGAGTVDAGCAGRAGCEQGVCRPVDCSVDGRACLGIRGHAERGSLFERRANPASAGGGQTLCRHDLQLGCSTVRREHDRFRWQCPQ